jgi:hypothetical protein
MINDVLIMSNSGEKLTLRNLKKKLKSMMWKEVLKYD